MRATVDQVMRQYRITNALMVAKFGGKSELADIAERLDRLAPLGRFWVRQRLGRAALRSGERERET
jgi:hypothetical protein